jgi:hypothetical protein
MTKGSSFLRILSMWAYGERVQASIPATIPEKIRDAELADPGDCSHRNREIMLRSMA